MQQRDKHNGTRLTRKEYRKEKAKQNRKGPTILQVVYYSIRLLIALVFELFKLFKS